MILVLCNGPEDKWGQEPPRHLVDVGGETLLERTVRQFAPRDSDIVVSAPDQRYKLPNAGLYVPKAEPEHLDADILLSTRYLWNRDGRTLVLLGDVWWSDAAVVALFDRDDGDWFYIGREHGSRYSGTDYGEIFGLSFYPQHQASLLVMAHEVIRLQAGGLWRGGMWEHYRLLRGIDPMEHRIDGHFLEIDDETEDFDFPQVVARWRAKVLT